MNNSVHIVGYYNPNDFPISVNVPQLNGSIQLEPGKFIMSRSGVKINDPIFENYCRPMCLQREISKTAVPTVLVPIATPPPPGTQGSPGFTASSAYIEKRPDGPPAKKPGQIMAFQNMDDAVRAGFVPGRGPMAPESPIVETASGIAAAAPPEITFADGDVKSRPPLDGRPLSSTIINIPPRETAQEVPTVTAPSPSPPPNPRPKATVTNILPKPDLPPELTVTMPVTKSSDIVGFVPDSQPPQPQPAPTSIVPPSNLPEPKLTPASESNGSHVAPPNAPPPPPPTVKPKNFSCPICKDSKTSNYRFRSQLDDHVRRKHADQYEDIMATIPKTR
jgi:hypothetical protein